MHNTGNPIGSDSILDLYDNSSCIDNYVNSQEDSFPDRFGAKRLTLAGLIKRSMALRNEINDFSGALTFKPEWSDVPMNVSEGVGGDGGALNLQAEALGNRLEKISKHGCEVIDFSFISSFTRKLKEKLSDIVSAKDFGVVGDGKTDDTGSFQKALDHGGVILITGHVVIKKPLRINSDTFIMGLPGSKIIYANESTDWRESILFINGPLNGTVPNGGYDNTKNIIFKNIIFDGTPRADLGQMVEFIGFAHHQGLIIEECEFINYSGNTHAIELNSTKDAFVFKNKFSNWVQNGAAAGSREFINIDSSTENGFPTFGPWDGTTCKNIQIFNNIFTGGDVAVGSHNFNQIGFHEDILVINNIISNMVTFGFSVFFWKNSIIANNVIKDPKRGVRVVASDTVSVSNNHLTDCRDIGLQIGYKDQGKGSYNITMSNNTLTRCGGSPLEGCENAVVSNNRYVDLTYVGTNVWSCGTMLDVTFINNIFPINAIKTDKKYYGPTNFDVTLKRKINDTLFISLLKNTFVKIPVNSLNNQGIFTIYTQSISLTGRPRGIYFYRCNTGESLELSPILEKGENVGVILGPLSGTTGSDGAMTIGIDEEFIYIENRIGTLSIGIKFD